MVGNRLTRHWFESKNRERYAFTSVLAEVPRILGTKDNDVVFFEGDHFSSDEANKLILFLNQTAYSGRIAATPERFLEIAQHFPSPYRQQVEGILIEAQKFASAFPAKKVLHMTIDCSDRAIWPDGPGPWHADELPEGGVRILKSYAGEPTGFARKKRGFLVRNLISSSQKTVKEPRVMDEFTPPKGTACFMTNKQIHRGQGPEGRLLLMIDLVEMPNVTSSI